MMDGASVFITIQKVYYPLLCILGIPANIFTFYMLCCRVCGMSDSARVYLSCLAVVDTWYLVWVTMLDLSLVFLQPQPFWHTHPWCGIISFLQYGMFYSSAWLVVAFTIERYLVLRVMVGRQRHLQVRHALLTCTTIILLSHLASVPLSWINAVVQVNQTLNGQTVTVPRCLYRDAIYSTVVVWVTSFLSSGVPILLIIIFNSLIAYQLLGSSRLFTKEERQTIRAFQRRGSARRTLLLLGFVSVAFVVLSLPRFVTYCILRTVHNDKDFDRDDYTIAVNVISDVANMLHNLNSATNFLLYCVASRRFRREIVNTFRCRVRPRELGSYFTQTTMKVFSVAKRREAAGQEPVSIVLTKLRHLESPTAPSSRNSDGSTRSGS
ncbi:probable G-protein coupled receptor 139 [Neoarius graeffei]|uniref:probable G-protein coupled receptor 139 n=1 Tax=Neoarius graeffei TaxID=443677 RepID=UPI00298CEEF0|nr:probable G-protein coupled receptor 139 [Neoarius graeffei]XP_060769522.1 probable G-protein coupled receptor 139 [Neoarius graeffei]XP_060769523.1 probable G-protein coupled receptor 139 [Neoarius graeffei]